MIDQPAAKRVRPVTDGGLGGGPWGGRWWVSRSGWRRGLLSLLIVGVGAVMAGSGLAQTSPGSWARGTHMPTGRTFLAATTGKDGRIYAIGGAQTNGGQAKVLNTLEAYDPSRGTWSKLARMPTARLGLAAAAGQDGRIYALGGSDNNQVFPAVEAYNPATNSWSTVAPMPTARTILAAATGSDGRIYAIGGINSHKHALRTVEVYNPSTNTWARAAPLHSARGALAAVAGPDGRIYAIGGAGPKHAFKTVEAYTPSTNTWARVAPMPAIHFTAAAAAADGHIFVMGGVNSAGALKTVVAYNPATNSWSKVPPMPAGRAYLAAAADANGHVYAIGGTDNVSYFVNTVEVYTPANAMTATGTPATPAATATVGSTP